MTHRTACLVAGATFLFACSDATGPSSGTFRAQLSGALVAALSGPSNASAFATEESPAPRFSVAMFAPQGDTIRVLTIDCPGQDPPEPGTHAVGEAESDCHGHYTRLLSTSENGTTIFETLSASSGVVRITTVEPGLTTGTFNFSGTLVVGESPGGVMGASGSFSATTIHALVLRETIHGDSGSIRTRHSRRRIPVG